MDADGADVGSSQVECGGNPVDDAICDDLNEAVDEDSDQACELADGSAVWTPAFADFNPERPVRCGVVDEAGFFEALAGYGGQIDGVADLGTPGAPDYNIFYVVRGNCAGEPTFWPATGSWSRYKGTSPSLTDERFATAAELVQAICAG